MSMNIITNISRQLKLIADNAFSQLIGSSSSIITGKFSHPDKQGLLDLHSGDEA